MPAVFISYRRADSASASGRIDDQLVARFGRANVFKDVDSIPPGVDFERYIDDAIRRSHVVLVIIGPRWLNASSGLFRRRLDDPADFVRLEIETALRLGVPIIPLLVDGASMPPAARLPTSLRPLTTLNALPVRPDPDFHRDMERVIPAVARLMAGPPPTPPEPALSQAPALLETPAPLPLPQRPKELTVSATPPAAPPLSPQGEGAGGEAPFTLAETDKRPAIILAAQTDAKPSRRAPGTLAATISALALIAVVATLLITSKGPGFLGAFAPSPTNSPDSAAETAQAAISTYAITQTADARQLTQPYQPGGVGPCDKIDPTPTDANSPYWHWTNDKGHGVMCSPSGIAEITGAGTLSFNGFDRGFPTAFTAKLTLSFHPAGDSASCVFLYLDTSDSPLGLYEVKLCSDGSWIDPATATRHCCISINGVFNLSIVVTSEKITIEANGQTVLPAIPYFRVVAMIGIQGNMSSGAWAGVSDFTLTPATT